MAALLPDGKQSYTTATGAPLVGGRLYTYDAGTSTPRPTYSDAAGLVPNTNPVILDARGEAVIFWSGAYKVVLRDAADVIVIPAVDNIVSADTYANDRDAALRADLASTSDVAKGSGLIGLNATLPYASGTSGSWLKKTTRNINLSALATGGTGTSGDPYSGWSASIAGLPWGKGLMVEDAWYTSPGGIVHPNLSIVCPGRGGVLQFTGITTYAGNIYIGGIMPNDTARPGYGSTATVYNMGIGALAENQVSFAFASVAGLSIGDEGYMALGADPTDGGQSHLRIFNRITNIVSNTVTFAIPVPEAVAAFPGSPPYSFSPTYHEFVKWSNGIAENIRLEGFKIVQTAGPTYDPAVWVARCRGVKVDIHFGDVRSGLYVCESVDVKGRTSVDRARLNAFGAYGSTGVDVDVHCDALDGLGVQYESQCRSPSGRLSLRGTTAKASNAYVAVIGGTTGARFDTLNLIGPVAANAPGLNVGSTSSASVGDAVIGIGINTVPLRYLDGRLNYSGRIYDANCKPFRIVIQLYKNMAAVSYTLPAGLLRSARGQLSSTTGVTRVRLSNASFSRDLVDPGNTINFFPAAGAFGELLTNDFATIGTDTASYAFNANPLNKSIIVTTDGTAVEGATLILEGEVYAIANDGVSGASDIGSQASLTGLKTLNFAAPGVVPGSPADQTITVTGASIGDRVSVSAPVTMPAGFILQAFVSLADTISVRWTQLSGAAVDPDGPGGLYRVDVWK